MKLRGRQAGERTNVPELRALLTGTRWALQSYKSMGLSVLRSTDSRVVQGVVTKYRSSSKQLHRLLRKLATLELASVFHFCTAFVRSDWNMADEGSRNL